MDRSDVCEGVVTGGKRGTWGSWVRSLSSFSILTWATLLCGAFSHTTNVLAQVWKQCAKSCVLNSLKPWARLNIYPSIMSFQVHCTKPPKAKKYQPEYSSKIFCLLLYQSSSVSVFLILIQVVMKYFQKKTSPQYTYWYFNYLNTIHYCPFTTMILFSHTFDIEHSLS